MYIHSIILPVNHNAPRERGVVIVAISLDLADANGVRALRAVADGERNLVSLLELVERNVLELVGVEEKILRAFCCAINLDEAKALIVLLYYGTILHTADRYCV